MTAALIEQKLTDCINLYKSADKCPDFGAYALEDFKNYTDAIMRDFAKENSFANVDILSESFSIICLLRRGLIPIPVWFLPVMVKKRFIRHLFR